MIKINKQKQLVKVKEKKLAENKESFLNQLSLGCEVLVGELSFKIDSKQTDMALLSSKYQSLVSRGKTTFILMDYDNIPRSLTIEELKEVLYQLDDYSDEMYNKKWSIREKISLSKEKKEVEKNKW